MEIPWMDLDSNWFNVFIVSSVFMLVLRMSEKFLISFIIVSAMFSERAKSSFLEIVLLQKTLMAVRKQPLILLF